MTPIAPVQNSIPAELKARPQWVNWRIIERSGRQTKVPFMPDGAEASSTDPTTWSTFEVCWGAYLAGGFDGVGFVFTEEDGLVGIDLDNCRGQDGQLLPWASQWVDRFDTYTEVSPSGTGVKLWVRGKNPLGRGRKKNLPGEGVGGGDAAVELYSSGRYFAVTGHVLKGHATIVEADEALKAFAEQFWPEPTATPQVYNPLYTTWMQCAWEAIQKGPDSIAGQDGSKTCFAAACTCCRYGLPREAALDVMWKFNTEKCSPLWSQAELEHKLADAEKAVRAKGEFGSMVAQGVRVVPLDPQEPTRDFNPAFVDMAAKCVADLPPEACAWLAEHLGVAQEVLVAFDVGWSQVFGAFAIPMRTADGFTTGVSLRYQDGMKRSVEGSKAGLYIPLGWEKGSPVVIGEGFSDTANLFDWCFPAIGRMSASSGTGEIQLFVKTYIPSDIIIVADRGDAGEAGARRLANRLTLDGIGVVRVVLPPEPYKDIRDWKMAGATAEDLGRLIAAAPVHRLEVRVRG